MRKAILGLWVAGALAGCTKDANRCKQDADCGNVAYPFCDLAGEYPPSAGIAGVCIVKPANCPVDRCGCEPHASTCSGAALETCDADGSATTTTDCSLGCAATGDRCDTFTPLNGLGAAMLAAVNEPDVTIPDMATIDTDSGTVRDAANLPVQVASLLVPQTGSSDIRVFIGKSFTLSSVTVSGSRPVAFVARDDIRIEGLLDVSATPGRPGAGQQATGPCVGEGVAGGGGGGNATAGGDSVSEFVQSGTGILAGGAALSGTALVGGCGGGGSTSSGHGGGAVQLDSLTRITVAASGRIGVGGAGGYDGVGGGSAGFVVIEAPRVELLGGIFANGGAGGACTLVGQNGPLSSSSAIAPSCGTGAQAKHGGNGGSSSAGPGSGHAFSGNAGGGGGAAGRLLITTVGDYTTSPGTIVSASITTTAMVPQ